MFIITNDFVPGMEITKVFGIVQGSTVRAKHIGRDIMASLKSVVGGELKGYTELLNEARDEATRRMIAQAQQLGANGIIRVLYQTNSIAQNAAELFCYGTAVLFEPTSK